MIKLKCFHGTSFENAQSIMAEQHFRKSENKSSRMGVGAYFFYQAGSNDKYALRCARELEKFHRKKHTEGYAILSCDVECPEEEYLDLYDPESLEFFHSMRYQIIGKTLQENPDFRYETNAIADTQVFDIIRKMRNLSVIRCPQYFGMFETESRIAFDKGPQFPKTFVPNVIMACVDTDKVHVKNIKIVEGGSFNNEYEGTV